jgi:hypothetical protein
MRTVLDVLMMGGAVSAIAFISLAGLAIAWREFRTWLWAMTPHDPWSMRSERPGHPCRTGRPTGYPVGVRRASGQTG